MAADTKPRILQHARTLFNTRGLMATTTRDVAAAVGISHGNLCYHYPCREALAAVLMNEFLAKIGPNLQPVADLPQNRLRILQLCQHVYAYRFLVQDRASLMRIVPEAKPVWGAWEQERQNRWHAALKAMYQDELLRDTVEPEGLGQTAQLLVFGETLWPAFAADATAEAHANAVYSLLHPVLSKRGRKHWDRQPAAA